MTPSGGVSSGAKDGFLDTIPRHGTLLTAGAQLCNPFTVDASNSVGDRISCFTVAFVMNDSVVGIDVLIGVDEGGDGSVPVTRLSVHPNGVILQWSLTADVQVGRWTNRTDL